MEDSDDDEQLRQALELSLQDQASPSDPPLQPEIISLESDDDGSSVQASPRLQSQIISPSKDIPLTAPPERLPHNFLGLDRRAMEQERLARKRQVDGMPLHAQDSALESRSAPAQAQGTSDRAGKKIAQSPQETKPLHTSTLQTLSNPSKAPKKNGPIFLDGAVKKTWALLKERADDIKLEEVLQSDSLKLAVLSAFQWDVPWLMEKMKESTRVIFVMQAKGHATKEQYKKETSGMPNLKLCFPPMDTMVNCMHSKLMLLSYSTYLRIVVPTANLTPNDWGETGVMENMLFLIDLPRLPGNERAPKESLTPFGRELVVFLEAKGLLPSVIESLYYFDFSRTKDFAFVHSIGGVHVGKDDSWRRTGYCALATAVKELGLETNEALSIDYVTSSLGTASMMFLSSIYLAAQGDSGMTEYGWRDRRSLAATITQREIVQKSIRANFHIFFPTHDTVASSTGGPHCAGTICFQQQYYESPFFEKGILRDCKSRREGMLMHNKVSQSLSPGSLLTFRLSWTDVTSPADVCSPDHVFIKLRLCWLGIYRISQSFRERMGQVNARSKLKGDEIDLQ